MEAKVFETEKQCHCIPTWLRVPDEEGKVCSFCIKPFGNDETRLLCHWLYSCCASLTRVHCLSHSLHVECTAAYHEHMERMDYVRFIERSVCHPECLTPQGMEKMRLDCRTKHQPLGSWCANCMVARQEQTKFFRCMACHAVNYCSLACQKQNWSNHKAFCRAKSTSDPELGLPDKSTEKACPCISGNELVMHERQGTGLCSYPPCNNCVFPPYFPSMCVAECALKKGKWHMIITQYCTVDCQEANMK